MKCLLVIAHPLAESLCHTLAQQASETLQKAGHEVITQDLYRMQFNAELSVEERSSYYTTRYHHQAVLNETQCLQEADALVLCFPTWWFNFPAILKGWFDRVWTSGIAYHHASDLGAIKPNLLRLKRVMVITTLGSSWWVDHLILFKPVKRILKIALLATCAPQAKLKMLTLYKSENLNSDQVDTFKRKIDKHLKTWT